MNEGRVVNMPAAPWGERGRRLEEVVMQMILRITRE